MMGEACEAVALHAGGEGGGGGGWESGSTAGSASGAGTASDGSSSIFSSTSSSLADEEDDDKDGATSSRRPASSSLSSLSLTSSESETTLQVDGGAAGGPLFELSTMLDHLPALRTGLSKYYQGRSQSFTSLSDVRCLEDLVKKTTPYIRRPKAFRNHTAALGVKNRLPKTVAKKVPRGRKPPACQGKREMYKC